MGGITDKVIHLTTINHIKKMPREERVSNRCKKNPLMMSVISFFIVKVNLNRNTYTTIES